MNHFNQAGQSSSIMQSQCLQVWWGKIWVLVDRQAGLCIYDAMSGKRKLFPLSLVLGCEMENYLKQIIQGRPLLPKAVYLKNEKQKSTRPQKHSRDLPQTFFSGCDDRILFSWCFYFYDILQHFISLNDKVVNY